MAKELQETLSRIAEKHRFLVARYQALLDQNNRLKARVADLEKQVADRDSRLEKLETRSEYLEISSAIAPNFSELESTRDMVADLVREIDRCIADLNT